MKKKTNARFTEEIKNRPLIALEEYSGWGSKIKFKCLVCDNEWLSVPNAILVGSGCPACGRLSSAKKQRQFNKIISVDGDVLFIDVSTKKYRDAVMKIDNSAYDYLINLGYGRISISKEGYARSRKTGEKYPKLVHRVLTGYEGTIDHINNNPLDNRRCNIRKCTTQENCFNQKIRSNNTTGFKGVCKHPSGRFRSYIVINNKQTHIGVFDTADEAHLAYTKKAKELYGVFYNAG